MKPANKNTWHSPIPYLFGSLALMLIIIALALIILACSYFKDSATTSGNEEEKPRSHIGTSGLEAEAKIVVIMAGDEKPTYIATPVLTSTSTSSSDQV
ncbi:conserved hypothetical protein [Ricinus communis]|uniref:Uncharacterized protein n=1 Tax=Ricinus communis TaxID=3988 RepID=B9SXT7_RICCO|nr:conserved hypothetical protein [Ricinus communis]